MSDNPDFNIENYSLEDLLEFIGIDSAKTKNSIETAITMVIEKFENLKNTEAIAFFRQVGTKLLDNFEKLQMVIDDIEESRDVPEPAENLLENEYYNSGDMSTFLANKLPNRKDNTTVVDDKIHMTQNRERLLIPNTHNVDDIQGNINPTLKNTYINIINVDSHYRELETNNVTCDGNIIDAPNQYLGTSTNFTFDLNEPLNNVMSVAVGSIELPLSWYPFSAQYGTTSFEISGNVITIPEGFYDDPNDLQKAIQKEIDAIPLECTITISSNTLRTTFDGSGNFKLNFIVNNDDCNIDNSGPKIDYNLGWLLGFRQPHYPMSNKIVDETSSYTSEGLIDTFGTRYLMLKINDFQSNRVTGGIVTLTNNQDKFKLPTYYKKTMASVPICSNSTGSVLPTESSHGFHYIERACRDGTQNPNPIIDGSTNLTQAQKYTAQQIVISRKNIKQNRYFAPADTDILLRFPLDIDITSRHIPYIYENGGSQKREYFGPTTLKRLHVSLLNDKGLPLNLNNMDFSFSLIIEQLYQY